MMSSRTVPTSANVNSRMTRTRRLLPWLAIVACAVAALPAAKASLMRAMDLAELTTSADQIVVGEVLSTESAWDGGHRNIHSTIEISVLESWKGSVPNDGRIRIRQLGGVVGEIEMTVYGMAQFARGERTLLFLRQTRVVGMSQGKRRVQWDSANKQWLADAPGGLGTTALGARAERLDLLREKVRALIKN
jgi:hypothetical protein